MSRPDMNLLGPQHSHHVVEMCFSMDGPHVHALHPTPAGDFLHVARGQPWGQRRMGQGGRLAVCVRHAGLVRSCFATLAYQLLECTGHHAAWAI